MLVGMRHAASAARCRRRPTRAGVVLGPRQRAALIIVHRLLDFLARVHYKRAVLHDWLAQRPPREDEESCSLRARGNFDTIA